MVHIINHNYTFVYEIFLSTIHGFPWLSSWYMHVHVGHGCDHLLKACSNRTINLRSGSDLHFRTFERIVPAFPGVPDDALFSSSLPLSYVSSVQVTAVAAAEPPGAFIILGTVTSVAGILIPVPGREPLTTVISVRESGIRETVT